MMDEKNNWMCCFVINDLSLLRNWKAVCCCELLKKEKKVLHSHTWEKVNHHWDQNLSKELVLMVPLRWESSDVLISSSKTLDSVWNSPAAALYLNKFVFNQRASADWWINLTSKKSPMLGVGGGIYIHCLHMWPKAEAQNGGMKKLDSTFSYTSETARRTSARPKEQWLTSTVEFLVGQT